MKESVKKRWVKALRKGDHKQCKKSLHDGEGFCCLGVLADIELDDWWEIDEGGRWRIEGIHAHLSADLREACELSSVDTDNLIHMNDILGRSFVEIAEWIEANL